MSDLDMFAHLEQPPETVDFEPTRQAGLDRLAKFVGRAGAHYARQRNYDHGADQRSNVSALSPWIRHRLITEEEVLRECLARHSLSASEKFVQEVFWRTYFKGWLEQHPTVWQSYRVGLSRALDDGTRNADCRAAIEGRTGIDCFDQWARELVETGYLHNHARMWFASIWIFTLRLPWEIGADFFLRHLLDGDPASNTLGWRWVAGLHTKGKTYLARASNIAKYTSGRFNPVGQLSPVSEPLHEAEEHAPIALPAPLPPPESDYLQLVTEEDCMNESVLPHPPIAKLGLLATGERSPLPIGDHASAFANAAVEGASAGAAIESSWSASIIEAAQAAGTRAVVTSYAPIGPVATALAGTDLTEAGLTLYQVQRRYDTLAWRHSGRGFFGLKKKIPALLRELGLAA
ncbi:MAG: FAD-binding domain-containing protein [Pseudomonadota bacterium]